MSTSFKLLGMPQSRNKVVTRAKGSLFPGENQSAKVQSEEDFLEFVKLCFSKKRKTLVNNLRELVEPEEVRNALGTIGVRADARAEQISIPNFAALYAALKK